MRRKLIYIGLLAALVAGGFYFYSSKIARGSSSSSYCAFCDSKVLNYQKFYEDDLVLALYTHKPILPGHCLVIPKRHIERFEMVSNEELARMGDVIKKVNQAAERVFGTSAYLLLEKNGFEVGQTVPHVHFHYIAREAGDSSTLKFLLQMYISVMKPPISHDQMEKIVHEMKDEMDSLP